jgi:hypothetical protein
MEPQKGLHFFMPTFARPVEKQQIQFYESTRIPQVHERRTERRKKERSIPSGKA